MNIFDDMFLVENDNMVDKAIKHAVNKVSSDDTRNVYKKLFAASILVSLQDKIRSVNSFETKRLLMTILKHAIYVYRTGGDVVGKLPKFAETLKQTEHSKKVKKMVDDIIKSHTSDNTKHRILKAAQQYTKGDVSLSDAVETLKK